MATRQRGQGRRRGWGRRRAREAGASHLQRAVVYGRSLGIELEHDVVGVHADAHGQRQLDGPDLLCPAILRLEVGGANRVEAAQHEEVRGDLAIDRLGDRHEPVPHLHAVDPQQLIAGLDADLGGRTARRDLRDPVGLVHADAHRQRQRDGVLNPSQVLLVDRHRVLLRKTPLRPLRRIRELGNWRCGCKLQCGPRRNNSAAAPPKHAILAAHAHALDAGRRSGASVSRWPQAGETASV